MANWVRKYKFNYEQIAEYTGLSEQAIRQRVYRGLDLHNLEIFVEFMNKNKKEKENDSDRE